MFRFFKDSHFNFLKYKYVALTLSVICIVGSIGYIGIHGVNLGIDFAGGHLIELKFRDMPTIEDMRSRLASVGYSSAVLQEDREKKDVMIRVQRSGNDEEDAKAAEKIIDTVINVMSSDADREQAKSGKLDLNLAGKAQIADLLFAHDPLQYLQTQPTGMTAEEFARSEYMKIATFVVDVYRKDTSDGVIKDASAAIDSIQVPHHEAELRKVLKDNTYAGTFARYRTEMVSAVVGSELAESAVWAIVYSLAGIFVYVWFRFNNRFSVAAVIATMHDVIITFGIYTFLGKEFNLPIVAALLTIVGYSLNDTIVIFVRIREVLSLKRKEAKEDYEGVLNQAINNTLSRTILTAGTTLIAVLFLFFMGGAVINDFAFTMLLGIFIGTYSSIYIASPVLVIWQKITGTAGGKITVKSAQASARA